MNTAQPLARSAAVASPPPLATASAVHIASNFVEKNQRVQLLDVRVELR